MMRYILDTHFLLWALKDDSRLPLKVREIILDENNDVFYSTVSVWEIEIKHQIHPDKMKLGGREISRLCREAGFQNLNLADEHIYELEGLRFEADGREHKDPFDKILIAQAKAEDMLFLTHDKLLHGYKEDCILIL